MRLVITVDTILLSFFTKISHKFYWLTGKTNFFLAKIAICILVASSMTVVFNYWFPLMLGYSVPLPFIIFYTIISISLLKKMNLCDKAENFIFNNDRVKVFHPMDYSLPTRFLWICGTILVIFLLFVITTSSDGYFIFKALAYAYTPTTMAFYYFIAVDPPAPGKSKIREWAESFSAGFQKLIPIKTKN